MRYLLEIFWLYRGMENAPSKYHDLSLVYDLAIANLSRGHDGTNWGETREPFRHLTRRENYAHIGAAKDLLVSTISEHYADR